MAARKGQQQEMVQIVPNGLALHSGKADQCLNLKDLQLPQLRSLALHTLTRIS